MLASITSTAATTILPSRSTDGNWTKKGSMEVQVSELLYDYVHCTNMEFMIAHPVIGIVIPVILCTVIAIIYLKKK